MVTATCQFDFVTVWLCSSQPVRTHLHVFVESGSISDMSITPDDLEKYLREDDDGVPLGDALRELFIDVETDAVADVRDLRERT